MLYTIGTGVVDPDPVDPELLPSFIWVRNSCFTDPDPVPDSESLLSYFKYKGKIQKNVQRFIIFKDLPPVGPTYFFYRWPQKCPDSIRTRPESYFIGLSDPDL